MNSRVRGILCIFFLLLALPSMALAVPASPAFFESTQPDGTLIVLRQRGDERLHWLEASDGYALVKNAHSGWYEYAVAEQGQLVPSGVAYLPGVSAPADISPGLRPARAQDMYSSPGTVHADGVTTWTPNPVSGNKKIVVILVGFQDQDFTVDAPVATWEDFVFGEGKSVQSFYDDMSRSTLAVTPAQESYSAQGTINDGIIRIKLQPTDFYFGNHCNAYISSAENLDQEHLREVDFVESVLARASAHMDFSSYDTNNDGDISPSELLLYMIPAGYEESGGAGSPAFWAHAWFSWTGEGTEHEVNIDGKVLTDWALNGEQYKTGVPMPMGVIVHELGHQMCGLPDLYDTSYTNDGLGRFSVMAAGSWGREEGETGGTTPVSLDAWSRNYLGWDELEVVRINGVRTLGGPVDTANKTLKVVGAEHRSTEYFLIENRSSSQWDRGLIGFAGFGDDFVGGLLILHVDEEIGTPGENDINRFGVGHHQGVLAKEANGPHMSVSLGTRGSANTLWYSGNPEYAGDGSFTPASTPASVFYDLSDSGFSITDIGPPGETVTATFSVDGGAGAMGSVYDLLLE